MVTPTYRTPNEINREQICLKDLIHLDVHYSELPRKLEIPDKWINRTVEVLRRNLELAVDLEKEIGGYGLRLSCSLTPENNIKDSYSRTYGLSAWVLLFVSYLEKLVLIDLDAVRKEISRWPCDDSTIFARLKVWALGKADLVPNENIITTLNQLSDEAFWDSYHARDLLLALVARWKELDQFSRSTIENRILQGPKLWKTEDESRFKERKARNILDRVTWLEQNGCELTIATGKLVDRLRGDTPEWKPEHAKDAARSFEIRSGIVKKNTDYSLLADEPIASILERASELSGRQADFLIDEDPFLGLSEEKPIRAFNALTCSAKKGNILDWAWDTFLYSEARMNDKPRFMALIAERLSGFTSDDLAKILRSASSWFEKSTSILADNYYVTYYKLAFKLVHAMSIQPDKGESSIIRGSKDPDWSMESINSPTGHLSSAILQSQGSRTFESGESFTGNFLLLLEQLLALPNDLHRYAMVILSRSLSWFFWVDPDWTQRNLLSAINSSSREDRQAFWAGVLWGGVRGKELFTILKPSILELAYSGEVESRGYQDAIVGLIFSAWKIKDEDKRWVSDFELKEVLIKVGDDFRCGILWQARHGDSEGKEHWLLPFRELIANVWPKQLAVKSTAVTERLCDIAFWSEDHFPDIVNLITPFLTKLERANHFYLNDDYVLKKYPNDLLLLLSTVLPEDVNKWPYNIGEYLDQMIEANIELGDDERFIELKRKWDAR